MKTLFTFLLAIGFLWASGQGPKPEGLKLIPSPSFHIRGIDSTLWIYEGNAFGFDNLITKRDGLTNYADWKLLADTITNDTLSVQSKTLVNFKNTPSLTWRSDTVGGSIKIKGDGPISDYLTNLVSTKLVYSGLDFTGINSSIILGESAATDAINAVGVNFIGSYSGAYTTNADFSNFIGNGAGKAATYASSSNFIGYEAGQSATNSYNSNFFGLHAGLQDTNAYNSNFLGYFTGAYATNANYSNFMGSQAGQGATNAQYSNFLGLQSGVLAENAPYSNFLGLMSGWHATNASNSNFLGSNTGNGATNASYDNFIGDAAGLSATDVNSSNFIGTNAGAYATNASYSNFLGTQAGQSATGATSSNFFGIYAGLAATNAYSSNFFGSMAGYRASNAPQSVFIGNSAGAYAKNAEFSNFFGSMAGYYATNAEFSNLFGYNAGKSFSGDTIGRNNIIIGSNISLPDDTNDALNLGGVLFGKNFYYNISSSTPSVVPTVRGKIGIGRIPTMAKLEVGDTARFYTSTHPKSYTDILGGRNIRMYRDSTETSGDPGLFMYRNTTIGGFISWDDELQNGLELGVDAGSAGPKKVSITPSLSVGPAYAANIPPANGLLIQGKVSIGVTDSLAILNLKGGTTTVASLNIPSGSRLATPSPGKIENDGSWLLYTRNSGQRDTLNLKGASYALPKATTTVRGGIKIGSGLTMIGDSLTATGGSVTNIATSGAITGGPITSTGTISHSTADGYLHVPATGTSNNGKVLMAGSSAGSIAWQNLPSASTGTAGTQTYSSSGSISGTGSEADMTGVTVSITPASTKLLIIFTNTVTTSDNSMTYDLYINVGGSNVNTVLQNLFTNSDIITTHYVATVTPGTPVTVKMRWNAPSQISSTYRTFSVIDLAASGGGTGGGGSGIHGSGTTGYIPKFSGDSTLTNSQVRDDGTNVGIGLSPLYKLDVLSADTYHARFTGSTGGMWVFGDANYSYPSGAMLWGLSADYGYSTPSFTNYTMGVTPVGRLSLNVPSDGGGIDLSIGGPGYEYLGLTVNGATYIGHSLFNGGNNSTTPTGQLVVEDKIRVGLGVTGSAGSAPVSPTAKIHIGAGSATAGTAPLKIESGALLTTPEPKTLENDGTNIYYTKDNGTRVRLDSTGTGGSTVRYNFAEMISSHNSTATEIPSSGVDYGIYDSTISAGTLGGFTFISGSISAITGIADYSGTVSGSVLVTTSTNHNLSDGQPIQITGTTNYNNNYIVNVVSPTTFYVTHTWSSSQTGSVKRAAMLLAGTCTEGLYRFNYNVTAKGSADSKLFSFRIWKGITTSFAESMQQFGLTGIYSNVSGSEMTTIFPGDYIYLTVRNITDNTGITIYNTNINLVLVSPIDCGSIY